MWGGWRWSALLPVSLWHGSHGKRRREYYNDSFNFDLYFYRKGWTHSARSSGILEDLCSAPRKEWIFSGKCGKAAGNGRGHVLSTAASLLQKLVRNLIKDGEMFLPGLEVPSHTERSQGGAGHPGDGRRGRRAVRPDCRQQEGRLQGLNV